MVNVHTVVLQAKGRVRPLTHEAPHGLEGPMSPLAWVMELIVLREHSDCLCLRCGTIFVEAGRQAVGRKCILGILFGRRGTTAAAVAGKHIAETTSPAAKVWVTLAATAPVTRDQIGEETRGKLNERGNMETDDD